MPTQHPQQEHPQTTAEAQPVDTHPFPRVLVPLSMSDPDAELLRYAALVAGVGGRREFHFVHVVTPAHKPAEDWSAEAIRRRLQEEVERDFGDALERVTTAIDVVEGTRVDKIIELAVERKADLILLGHRKARSGRRSLARRLAMIAPCSVWMVPEGSPCSIRRPLVPIDLSEHSADALRVAVRLAHLHELARLQTLHVFFDPSTIRYDEHVEEIRGREDAAFAEFVATIDNLGVGIEPLFHESNNPGQAIGRLAKAHDVDLVIMNTRGRSCAASILIGSVTSQIIMETEIPVLAVKHYGAKLDLFHALVNHRLWDERTPKTN